MRILVTGSNGLLGQKLSDLLLQQPNITFLATGLGVNRHLTLQNSQYATLDTTNAEQCLAVCANFKPTHIIHAAAMTNVDECELNQQACDNLNINAVKNLCEAALAVNAKLIYLSTDFIFDGTKKMYTETDLPNPLSYYGNSKYIAEKYIQLHQPNFAILRTILVYGVVANMSRSNIVLWAYDALKNKKAIKVVNDQFRTPTLAEDLAMGCFLACKHNAQGIYNIAGSDFMNMYELVERVAIATNLSMENVESTSSNLLNQPAKRPPITGLNIEKAKRDLGYEPHTFAQGIELVLKQAGLSF